MFYSNTNNNTIIKDINNQRYKIENLRKEDLQLSLDVSVLIIKFNIKVCLYDFFF